MTKNSNITIILNGILMIIVSIPAIICGYYVCNSCNESIYSFISVISDSNDILNNICYISNYYPIYFVNIVFFFNVCVLFWFISLLVDSTWLIGKFIIILTHFLVITNHFTVSQILIGRLFRQ